MRRFASSPWAVGLLLGALHFARGVTDALRFPLERFDEGIQLSSGWFISHGEMPLRDFYQPYGPGFGVPGTIGRWLFGDGAFADRLVYVLAPAAVTAVAYVFMTRRSGWRYGLLLAVLTLPSTVPRYALCWLAILAGLLIAQRAMDSTRERSFAAGIAARPWLVLIAGCVMATGGWVRGEYSIAAVLWGALVLIAGRDLPRGRRIVIAAVPAALALLPYAVIVVTGGAEELSRWAGYAVRDFRTYRGQPIDFGPLGDYGVAGARLLFSYIGGALLILLWAVHLAARALGRRGLLARDATLIATFLALLAAFATYAQSVRFSPENGVAVLPGIAAAWLVLRPREGVRLPRAAVAVAAALFAIAFLPMLRAYVDMPADAVTAGRKNEAPEQVPKLDHIPVRETEWPSMAGIHALWRERGLSGKPVLATNKRNDLAFVNGAYLPWFLEAPPAAWITTHDPGLADRDSVQRDAAAQLCRNRAPVVEEDQDPVFASQGAFDFDDHLSRHLDEFIALNYGSDAVVGFYRLRLRDTADCVQPDAAPDAAVRTRREAALRRDDIPQAAALSVLLVERAEAAGRRAAADDVAGALLGGFWVPDAQLPQGPERAGLLALRSRGVVPGEAEAALAPGSALTRLATTTAYLTYRPPGAPPEESQSVAGALLDLVQTSGRWPATVRNLFALQPPSEDIFADVARHGGDGAELERVRFEFLSHGGAPKDAAESGVRLARLLDRRPIDQGNALVAVAATFDVAHEPGCAARARALGDSVPGVHAAGPEDPNAACSTPLPRPSLG